MNLHQPFSRWGSLAILSLAAVVTLLAFNGGPTQHPAITNHAQDTIPQKRNKVTREEAGDRDLDKELRQLDKTQEQLDKLQEKDWTEIQRTVEESIRKIDVEKIQQQVQDALQKIDYEKIGREVKDALRKIDFDKIQRDIDQSLADVKKVDREEIKREIENAKQQVKEALEKEEWKEEMKKAQKQSREEVKIELENAKKEIEKARQELKHQKLDLKKEMENAKVEVDKAKAEVKGYQEMIYDMEKDGLLSTKEDYTIEYKSGDLFINNKKQPQDVTDKYKKYFRKKNIAIKKQDGKIDIDHHESSDS